jgi:hypothetical protein
MHIQSIALKMLERPSNCLAVPIIKQLPKASSQSRLSSNKKRIDSESFSVLTSHNSILNEFEKLTNEFFSGKQKAACQKPTSVLSSVPSKLTNNKNINIIARAVANTDFIPSPYDESSLTLKVLAMFFFAFGWFRCSFHCVFS